MKQINIKLAIRIIATFLIMTQVITSGFVSAIDEEIYEVVGIRYAQWDESDHYDSSTGKANSESYADANIGFFTGTHTLGQTGSGQAEGYIKHWVEWNCPIEDNDGKIKIIYDYGIIALLQKGIGSGMVHAKIWLTFFIDDSQHEVTIYDKTIEGLELPDFSLEVSERETWSKTLELTQKIYTIGVQANFELEFTGKGKPVVGFAIDHINNKTTLVEITWTGTAEQQSTEAVNAFYASLEPNIDGTDLTYFQQTSPCNKLSPAEFDPADELIITWPKKYGDGGYDAEPFHVGMVAAAEDAVNVRINVNRFGMWNPWLGEWIEANDYRPIPVLQAAGVPIDNVIIEKTMTTSIWVRDYGPNFVIKNDKLSLVDFGYYAFAGGWYRLLDNIYPTVHGIKNLIWPNFIANFFLRFQGGNYISDGDGTAFVCWERCADDNEDLSQEDVADRLEYFLGLDNVVFLESQVMNVSQYGDETGHIDMFCKMLDEDTFLVAEWRDEDPWTNGENAEICDRNAQLLIDMGYEVIRIPTIRDPEKPKVIWSYTNSLIINGVNNKVVLVSEYGAPEDAEVITIYQNAMPDYEIRPIDSTEIIKHYGAIHCTTMTRPYISSDPDPDPDPNGSIVIIEVYDSYDCRSIMNALVGLGTEEDIWRFQSTDQFGVATFENVAVGNYILEVSASGYTNTTGSVSVLGPELTTETIYLTSD